MKKNIEQKTKKQLLQEQVIKLLKDKKNKTHGESNADLVRLEKKFDAVLRVFSEKMSTQLLTKIEKHVTVDNLDKALAEISKAIEKHKAPSKVEVVQTERPKWYKDPIAPKDSVKVANVVEVKGTVKAETDASYWVAFGSVLSVAFQGLFDFLGKYAQKTFKVMPAKEHYTTPQLVVLSDPKTGNPVSLKDLFSGHGPAVIQMTGGNRSSQSSTSGSTGKAISRFSGAVSATGTLITPASGKKIRVYGLRFTIDGNADAIAFTLGSEIEKYRTVKAGGMYGTNLTPNYVEGSTDQPLTITVTNLVSGSVQVIADYEVVA